MSEIVSAATIRKRFRMRYGVDLSLEAINSTARKIGYKPLSYGMLRGYDKSVFMALLRRWKELLDCDKEVKERKAVRKTRPMAEYNPDAFHEPAGRKDYEWELDESVMREGRRIVREVLGEFLEKDNGQP